MACVVKPNILPLVSNESDDAAWGRTTPVRKVAAWSRTAHTYVDGTRPPSRQTTVVRMGAELRTVYYMYVLYYTTPCIKGSVRKGVDTYGIYIESLVVPQRKTSPQPAERCQDEDARTAGQASDQASAH